MSSIAGNLSGVLCKIRRGYNRQSGTYTEYLYEGPRDTIYGLTGRLDAADNWEIDQEGPRHTLKVRYASVPDDGKTEVPVDEIRLQGNPVSDSIYNLPGFAVVRQAIVIAFRAQMQDPDPAFNVQRGLATLIGADWADTQEGIAALELFTQLNEGVGHYTIIQPTLVRTRVASATYDWKGTPTPFNNIGRIISPGAFVQDAALGSNNLLTVILPTGSGNTARKAYGWLKHYPEFTQAAGNKAILSQQYDFGLWNTFTYGTPI